MQSFQNYEIILKAISCIRRDKISIKDFVDFLKLFTKNPEEISKIIEMAIRENIIKREGRDIIIISRSKSESKIIKERCNDYCRRCNRKIKNCFYISIYNITFGPYGSECVKKFLS